MQKNWNEIKTGYLSGLRSDQDLIAHFQHLRKNKMRSEGAVYTPPWIAQKMLSKISLTSTAQTIIEPSCGHGSFVLPLIRKAKHELSLNWTETFDWFRKRVRCVDLDDQVTSDLREILALLFLREGVFSAQPQSFDNVITADGLRVDLDGIDIAIGNPPYIRTQGLDPDYLAWLRDNFEVARKGNIDIYYAFLDRYVTSIPRCVFIVPNGCLQARSAKLLRQRILPRMEEITDFRETLVFPGARTYTCILSSSLEHSGDCCILQAPDFKATFSPWEEICPEQATSSPRLALSGVATLADDVFVLKRDRGTGLPYARIDDITYWIEPAITRPFLKVSRAFDAIDPEKFILFPYDRPSPATLIAEDRLKQSYPIAYSYLCAKRERLAGRDSGKTDNYPAWYAYGRTQGFHDLASRPLIFVPRVIGGSALPTLVDTTEMTKVHGAPLHVSGFAVETENDPQHRLLSEEFRSYVRQHGKPKPGKNEPFYAISSRHVNDFLAKVR